MKKVIGLILLLVVVLCGCDLKRNNYLGTFQLERKYMSEDGGRVVLVFADGPVAVDSVKRLPPAAKIGEWYDVYRDRMTPFYYRIVKKSGN